MQLFLFGTELDPFFPLKGLPITCNLVEETGKNCIVAVNECADEPARFYFLVLVHDGSYHVSLAELEEKSYFALFHGLRTPTAPESLLETQNLSPLVCRSTSTCLLTKVIVYIRVPSLCFDKRLMPFIPHHGIVQNGFSVLKIICSHLFTSPST